MATVLSSRRPGLENRQQPVPELADRRTGGIKEIPMRVTQSLNQAQFLSALTQLESNLSQTQNQISTNLAFTTPAQNPVAAGSVNNYNQALAQSQQYDSNANSAQTRLSIEDSALAQVQTELQSLRDLALQANNSSISSSGRTAIAAQATQIQNSL